MCICKDPNPTFCVALRYRHDLHQLKYRGADTVVDAPPRDCRCACHSHYYQVLQLNHLTGRERPAA